MINIKKVNVELILSVLFSLLVFVVILNDTRVIWNHLHFFNDIWSFEIGSTWGRQMALTQNVVVLSMIIIVLFIVIMRIRQVRRER